MAPSSLVELDVDELDALHLVELRRAVAWQVAALVELIRWAGDLTTAVNSAVPRRYGVHVEPPRFPPAPE